MSAKLYFIHSAMNGGKSMQLIAKSYSFKQNNIPFLCIKPSIDNRDYADKISSRVGISVPCLSINTTDNIYSIVEQCCLEMDGRLMPRIQWVLCDESQFFTAEQIDQLAMIVDKLGVNVMCYGLRTDFTSHLFDGSKRLFEIADSIEEIKNACSCGNKAIINARFDSDGNIIVYGEQIDIGGNEKYRPMCRKCYNELLLKRGIKL